MTGEPQFTVEYFYSECLKLRDTWSTAEFWSKPGVVETTLKALGYVYARTPKNDSAALLWEATVREMIRRNELMMLRPKAIPFVVEDEDEEEPDENYNSQD